MNEVKWKKRLGLLVGNTLDGWLPSYTDFEKLYNTLSYAMNQDKPINVAIYRQDIEAIKALIKFGYDVSDWDNDAIITASSMGYVQGVELLLSYPDTDPTARNYLAILCAAEGGHIEIMKILFDDFRFNPSSNDNELFVLANNVKNEDGYLLMIKLLLENPNINPSARKNQALLDALTRKRLDVFQILINDPRTRLMPREVKIIIKQLKTIYGEFFEMLAENQSHPTTADETLLRKQQNELIYFIKLLETKIVN